MINIIKLLKKNKHKKAKEARENEQKRILSEVFQGGGIILNGPFKGMKYISDSHGSTLLPKVLGSYEEPIQDWIDIVINNKPYKKIIDIGCAEGYYACGLQNSSHQRKFLHMI